MTVAKKIKDFADTRPQLGLDEAGRAARSIIKLLEEGCRADSSRLVLSLTRLVGALGGDRVKSEGMTGPQILLYVVALQQVHGVHSPVEDGDVMSVTMPQGGALPRAHASVGPKDGLSAYRSTRQGEETK